MVEIGSAIQARVVRIEHYGIFLKYESQDVFINLPELSWFPVRNLQETIHIGDVLNVHVLRYNYSKKTIVGSLRRLHPEKNPYRELSRLDPEEPLSGKVMAILAGDVTVQFPNGAWGHVAASRMPGEVKVGDSVEVLITGLEVDEGILSLEPLPREKELTQRPTFPTAVGNRA